MEQIAEKIKKAFNVMENKLFSSNELVDKIFVSFKNQLLNHEYTRQQLTISDEVLNVFARLLWRLKTLRHTISKVHTPKSFMPVIANLQGITSTTENQVIVQVYFPIFGRYLNQNDVAFFKNKSLSIDPNSLKDFNRKSLTEKEDRYNRTVGSQLRTESLILNSRFLHYVCMSCIDPVWRRIPLWMYLDENHWDDCAKWASNPEIVLSFEEFLDNFVTFIVRLLGATVVEDFGKMTASKHCAIDPDSSTNQAFHSTFALGKRPVKTSRPKNVDWLEHDFVQKSHKRQAVQVGEFVSQFSDKIDLSEEWSNTGVCSVSERENRDCAGPVMCQSDSSADSFDTLVATLNQDGDVCNSLSTEDSLGWEFDLDDLM
jgi:hypothetical protein